MGACAQIVVAQQCVWWFFSKVYLKFRMFDNCFEFGFVSLGLFDKSLDVFHVLWGFSFFPNFGWLAGF